MSSYSIHGGRMARLIDESGQAWYHVYNRVAGEKDRMLFLEQSEARGMFQKYLEFYASAYCCEVATYVVMGNHFHLIVKMNCFKELAREELEERVKDFYPNTHEMAKAWSEEHWEQFNRRLFSLPDLMRNIQQGFARWFNKNFKRRGRFWADRFKSTLLYGERSLLECMQYVDLNPVRAGLVESPDEYSYSAYFQRLKNCGHRFLILDELMGEKDSRKAFKAYREIVFMRGGVPTKEKHAVIKQDMIDSELSKNFNLGFSEDAQEHFRFYVDGLVIGSRKKIEEWLTYLKGVGYYKRRKNPIPIKDHLSWYSMREQRSHFEGGRGDA